MRKLFVAFAALSLMLCFPACATTDKATPTTKAVPMSNDLFWWVNRVPTDEIDEHKDIWLEVPAIGAAMEKALGPDRMQTVVGGWGKGAPAATLVFRTGNVIHFGLCEDHNCGANGVEVFVGRKEKKDFFALACWQERGKAVLLDADGSKKELADDACDHMKPEELLRMSRYLTLKPK